MRNAALILGIIGGLLGMMVGLFSYGYTELIDTYGEWSDVAEQVDNVSRVRAMALIAPILALAGGAMARARGLIGGGLMLASTLGMYWGFVFNVFTMFPIAMTGLGGVLAIAARQPDVEKAH